MWRFAAGANTAPQHLHTMDITDGPMVTVTQDFNPKLSHAMQVSRRFINSPALTSVAVHLAGVGTTTTKGAARRYLIGKAEFSNAMRMVSNRKPTFMRVR